MGRSQSLTSPLSTGVEPLITCFSFLFPSQKAPLTETTPSEAHTVGVPRDRGEIRSLSIARLKPPPVIVKILLFHREIRSLSIARLKRWVRRSVVSDRCLVK